MSKIENFTKKKASYESLRKRAEQVSGKASPNIDKNYMGVSFTKMVNADWSPMEFHITAQYGYYGNSSAYSVTDALLGTYLAKAIKARANQLLADVVEMARIEMEAARKAAEDEAREVLAATAADSGAAA